MPLSLAMMPRPILVTGVAGFVGMHAALHLLETGWTVVGIDDLNPYYPPVLKRQRLAQLYAHPRASAFSFVEGDVADPLRGADAMAMAASPVAVVLHLAAQAGVRYSIENPQAYAHSNLLGMTTALEACRQYGVGHLVYASSSSVYGARANPPFVETDAVDTPSSFYAATKRANEVMVQSYCHLYGLRATGLRLFTVYGPWGRPDMAPWIFTESILNGSPIRVFGDGLPRRDFTHVDDAVDNILRLIERPLAKGDLRYDHQVVNVGSDSPVTVNELIETIESLTGRLAIRIREPLPMGDVPMTAADPKKLEALGGRRPAIRLREGMKTFVDWYSAWPAIAEAVRATRHRS